jgi:Putative zinc-finger
LDRFSEIVKQRLAAGSAGAKHPAADLLSAFAEHKLRPTERERIIDHLGTCSHCRAAVAFAMRDVEEAQAGQAVRSRPSPSWWRFPVAMGWAAGGAALAVAVGVGLLIQQDSSRFKAVPRLVTAPKAVSTIASAQSPCGTGALGCESRAAETKAKPKTNAIPRPTSGPSKAALARHAPTAAAKPAPPAGSAADAFAISPQSAFTAQGTGQASYRPAPAANATSAQSAALADNQPLPTGSSETITAAAPPASAAKNLEIAAQAAQVSPSRAGAAGSSGSAAKATKKESASAFNGRAIGGPLLKTPLAHWSLSVTGQLQRRNWDDTVTTVEPTSGATFRAVAAEGIEVWAGGSRQIAGSRPRPVLFHSSDAGTTWKQVSGPWKGTILRVLLQAGGVVTVGAEDGAWQTRDGGQTWTVMPRS